MRRFRRPENKLAGVVLSRRRSCRRTILQPRRFVFAAEVRNGRPEVGVCFPRRFAGGREGLARRGASACRGGSCSPWRFAGGREGWRVLPAEVRRRPRRSSSPQNFGLPRRFVFTVEVIRRWPRSLACASREGSPAAAKVPLALELRLAEEVRVRRGGSPVTAKVGVCFQRRFAGGREGHDALDSSRWSCAAGCCMQHVQR